MNEKTESQKTFTQKLRLLFAGKKGYVLAAGAAVILAAVLLIAGLTAKETLITGVLLGDDREVPLSEFTPLNEGFLESKGLDPATWEIRLARNLAYSGNNTDPSFVNNFTAIDKLDDYVSQGMIDFVLGDADSLSSLAYSDFFMDLRQILTPEQLESWAPRIRYMDLAVIEQLEQMALTQEYPKDFTLPDPAKPEAMEEPVPIFIDVTGCPGTQPLWPGSEVYYAVALNTEHPTVVKDYAEHLLG